KVWAAVPRSPADEYDVGHGAFGWDGLTRFDSLSEEAFELPQGAGHGRTLVANRPHVATADLDRCDAQQAGPVAVEPLVVHQDGCLGRHAESAQCVLIDLRRRFRPAYLTGQDH